MRKIMYLIISAAVIITGCGDSFYKAQEYLTGPVEGVGLKKSTSIVSMESEQLYAVIAPVKTENKNVQWESSDTSVVTVDNDGLVTAVAAVNHGETKTAVITVTTEEGGFKAECAVTVVEKPVPVTSVTINKNSSSLVADTVNNIYGAEQMIFEIFPSNATNQSLTWESSAPDTASVDAAGLVAARQPGKAKITVTASSGVRASCIFNVVAAPVAVTGISLNKTGTIIKTGDSERLFASLLPANATNQNVTWQSSNTAIADVDVTGSVRGIADGGPVTITATTDDGNKTATATITVVAVSVPVTGVNLTKAVTTINIGNQEKLNAGILPSNATNQALAWKSSSSSVVSVDSGGIVTGLTVGSSTVTVTTADGGFSKSCIVSVISDPTYNVNYYSNGGTGIVPVDNNTYLSGAGIVLMNSGTLARSGYTFTGWTDNSGGTGTVYSPGTLYTVTDSNITFYARWTANPTYSVIYDDLWRTGGSVPVDSNTYEEGQQVTVLGNTGNLVKTGYAFSGWYIVSSTVYKPGQKFTIGKGNVILSAKWSIAYPVIYNGNGSTGGSVPLESNSYAYGQNVTVLGNTNGLVRTNYNFTGWCTDSACSGTVYQAGDICTMPDNTLTIYAKWTEKTEFTVTYNNNGATGGSVPVDSSEYTPGSSVTVMGNTGSLQKNGSFIGWTTNSDGSGTCYTSGDILTMTNSDVTLYAKWHTTYYALGDTGPAGGKIFYNKGSYSDGWQYLESMTTDLTEANNPDLPGYPQLFKWAHAVQACNDLVYGGYSDWYMPSQTELEYLCDNKVYVGSFSVRYLSSTQNPYNNTQVYGYQFDPKQAIYLNKTYNEFVRPIRAF